MLDIVIVATGTQFTHIKHDVWSKAVVRSGQLTGSTDIYVVFLIILKYIVTVGIFYGKMTSTFIKWSQRTCAILRLVPLHSYLYFPTLSLNIQHFWKGKKENQLQQSSAMFSFITVTWVKKCKNKKIQVWFSFRLTGGRFWFWLGRRMAGWKHDKATRGNGTKTHKWTHTNTMETVTVL